MKKKLFFLLALAMLLCSLTLLASATDNDPADRSIGTVHIINKDYPFDSELNGLAGQGLEFAEQIKTFREHGAGGYQRVYPANDGVVDFEHEGYHEDGTEDVNTTQVFSQEVHEDPEEATPENTIKITASQDYKYLYVTVKQYDKDVYVDEEGEETTENVKLSVDYGGHGENVVDYILSRGGFTSGSGVDKFTGHVWNADLGTLSHSREIEDYCYFLFKIDMSEYEMGKGDYLGINMTYTSLFNYNEDPIQNVIFLDNPTHEYNEPTAWNTVMLGEYQPWIYEVTELAGEECIIIRECYVTGQETLRTPESFTVEVDGVTKTLPVRILGHHFLEFNDDVKKCIVSSNIAQLDYKAFWTDYLEEVEFEDCDIPDHEWNDYHDMVGGLLDIPEGKYIAWERPFYHALELKKARLPADTKEVPFLAFRYCLNLEDIVIPDGVEDVSYQSFYRCDSLKKIDIPKSVKTIGDQAFYACPVLEELILPEGIEKIGKQAAYYTQSLMKVVIPGKDVDIAGTAFGGTGAESRILYIEVGGKVEETCIKDCYIYHCLNDAHELGDWETTVEATAETGDGTMTRKCLNCMYYEEKPIDWPCPFGDIKAKDWYRNAVKYVYTHGKIMQGSAGKFNPKNNMTRAEFCQALYMLDSKGAPANNKVKTKFDDVPSGKWFTGAVRWANLNGIVAGTGDKTFSPNSNITRQEICSILYRYMDYALLNVKPPKDVEFPTFTDEAKIAKWAKNDMILMGKLGIITGSPNGDGTFLYNPTGKATRAEIAQILMSLCQKNPGVFG